MSDICQVVKVISQVVGILKSSIDGLPEVANFLKIVLKALREQVVPGITPSADLLPLSELSSKITRHGNLLLARCREMARYCILGNNENSSVILRVKETMEAGDVNELQRFVNNLQKRYLPSCYECLGQFLATVKEFEDAAKKIAQKFDDKVTSHEEKRDKHKDTASKAGIAALVGTGAAVVGGGLGAALICTGVLAPIGAPLCLAAFCTGIGAAAFAVMGGVSTAVTAGGVGGVAALAARGHRVYTTRLNEVISKLDKLREDIAKKKEVVKRLEQNLGTIREKISWCVQFQDYMDVCKTSLDEIEITMEQIINLKASNGELI